MKEYYMRIGELAKFFGISVKALRVYERMGLLAPAKTDDQNNYRYYTADQIKELDAVISLKRLGFTLSEIKKLLKGGMTHETFMEALVRKKTKWEEDIAVAESKIYSIDQITKRLAASKPAAKIHALTEDERAVLLAKLVCVEELHGAHILSEALWV